MGMGKAIRMLRKQAHLNQVDVVKALGVSKGLVSQWEHDKTNLTLEQLSRLARLFGCEEQDFFRLSEAGAGSAEGDGDAGEAVARVAAPDDAPIYKEGGEGEPRLSTSVPLVTLGYVHAGEFSDEELFGRSVEAPYSVVEQHPHAQAMVVEGDCMSRVIPEGAIVIFDPDLEPTNGRIVIAETADYQAVLRRWLKGSDTLVLAADSYTDHEDIVIKEDEPIRVIGVVVDVRTPRDLL